MCTVTLHTHTCITTHVQNVNTLNRSTVVIFQCQSLFRMASVRCQMAHILVVCSKLKHTFCNSYINSIPSHEEFSTKSSIKCQ